MCVSVIIREIWLKVCKYSYSNFQYPIPIVFLIKSNENSQWDILYIYNYNLILSDWSKWLPAIYFNSATNSIVSFLKITYKQGVKKLWEGGGTTYNMAQNMQVNKWTVLEIRIPYVHPNRHISSLHAFVKLHDTGSLENQSIDPGRPRLVLTFEKKKQF